MQPAVTITKRLQTKYTKVRLLFEYVMVMLCTEENFGCSQTFAQGYSEYIASFGIQIPFGDYVNSVN